MDSTNKMIMIKYLNLVKALESAVDKKGNVFGDFAEILTHFAIFRLNPYLWGLFE